MIIDSESKSVFAKKLNELVASQHAAILHGQYPDLASFERQRGVLVGLGLALELLEDKPLTETQSEDETNDAAD